MIGKMVWINFSYLNKFYNSDKKEYGYIFDVETTQNKGVHFFHVRLFNYEQGTYTINSSRDQGGYWDYENG